MSMRPDRTYVVKGRVFTLRQTCGGCPEQYDAFVGDMQVGYLRLRHGSFTVSCPDVGGEEVFCSSPHGDGAFDMGERDTHLYAACSAIASWLKKQEDK